MKIFILGPAYPYRGGIASFSEVLANSFQEQGHQVKIYTYILQYPSFLFPGKTQYSSDRPPNHLTIERAIHAMNPLNWRKVGKEIAQAKPDLVIWQFWLPFMGLHSGFINRQIKQNKHTKIIALTHNVIPHEKRIGDRWLTNYFIQSCDGFVAMSKAVLEDLKQFTQSTNKRFAPHPIYNHFGKQVKKEQARKKLSLKKEAKIILFFGLVRHYKGLDILLKAMADKRVRDLNIRLIVAGEYYEGEEKYKQIMKENKLTSCVISRPEFIANEEVKYYFCAADMIVQPYRTATQSGISQIAYHFERPMIVTKVGGLPEIVPDGKVGYVVAPENPTAIADALVDFYTTDKASYFAQQLLEEKKRFSWENMTKAILEL